MSKTAQLGKPSLNRVQVVPLLVVRKTATSVAIYMVFGAVGSMVSALTGVFGSPPLISVHVAVPLAGTAETAPLQTCAISNPDITTIIVLMLFGSGARSQM